jgi:hypothetical protein
MKKEETERLIKTVIDQLAQETCPCDEIEDETLGAALAQFSFMIWEYKDPSLTMHCLLYCYKAGKRLGEEKALEMMLTGEKEKKC